MDETRRYHEKIYSKKKLYSDDSWLKEPESVVLELLKQFPTGKKLNILDLCSGVGRNAIRLAELLKNTGSRITCVDMLEAATEKLGHYSREFNVQDMIGVVNASVVEYHIPANNFDYIISWSCIEHLDRKEYFNQMLYRIQQGTRSGGINCLMINANVTEYDVQDKVDREALIELNFKLADLLTQLKNLYSEWKILQLKTDSYINHLKRYGREYIFKSHPVILAAQKP